MTRRTLPWGLALLLLLPTSGGAQGPGLFVAAPGTGRPDCAAITTPVNDQTWCFVASDPSHVYYRHAGAWVPLLTGGGDLTATYILQTPAGDLPNAQALSTLGTGLLVSTTGTGVLSQYPGASCPGQAIAALSASGVPTCVPTGGVTPGSALAGTVTISNAATTGSVVFGVAQADTTYVLTGWTRSLTGTPPHVTSDYLNKTTTGFDVEISAPPGAGNSIEVNWHLNRSGATGSLFGGGLPNQIGVWSGSTTLTGYTDFLWDQANTNLDAGGNTLAGASSAFVVGSSNTADGQFVYIHGLNNDLTGASDAGAWGETNVVSGSSSFAFGSQNTLTGTDSSAHGERLDDGGNSDAHLFGEQIVADRSSAAFLGVAADPLAGIIVEDGTVTILGLQYPTADGAPGDVITTNGSGVLSFAAPGGGSISGSGTAGTLPIWTGASALGDSLILQTTSTSPILVCDFEDGTSACASSVGTVAIVASPTHGGAFALSTADYFGTFPLPLGHAYAIDFDFWFYTTANPSGGYVTLVDGATSGIDPYLALMVDSTGQIGWSINDGAFINTGANAILLSAWNHVQGRLVSSLTAGGASLTLNGVAQFSNFTQDTLTDDGPVQAFYMGPWFGTGTATFVFDDVAVTTPAGTVRVNSPAQDTASLTWNGRTVVLDPGYDFWYQPEFGTAPYLIVGQPNDAIPDLTVFRNTVLLNGEGAAYGFVHATYHSDPPKALVTYTGTFGSEFAIATFGPEGLYIGTDIDGSSSVEDLEIVLGADIAAFRSRTTANGLYINSDGALTSKPGITTMVSDQWLFTTGTYAAPPASALVTINSTAQGVVLPRMTTTQRDAISSPAEGLMIFDLTTHKLNYHNGTSWVALP